MKRFVFLSIVSVLFLICCATPDIAAQTLEELRDKLKAHSRELSPELGRSRLPKEEVEDARIAYETAREILSKNISEEFRVWTLKRKAAALITLAYEETPQYLPELIAVVDELDGVKTCETIFALSEKHVLIISSQLAVKPIEGKDGRKIAVDPKPLAERMTLYAREHPGRESDALLRQFLRTLDQPIPRRESRDKRLAAAIPVLADYYSTLNDESSQSFAMFLRCTQRRLELPGKPMMLIGFDLDGKLFDVALLKDKVVLVQFWGTWCKPCLHEMPQLVELYEKYHLQGFEILGINTAIKGDERPQTVRRFLDMSTFGSGKKITWPILHEGLAVANRMEPVSKLYGIEELPVLILIGRNGKVIAVNPSPTSLDLLIQDALTGVSLDDLTDEERAQAEATRKKQDAELDRQIRQELDTIEKEKKNKELKE